MKCATCGAECKLFRHEYYTGTWQKPTKRWAVVMPLYYLGDRPYCSPECATIGRDSGELQTLT